MLQVADLTVIDANQCKQDYNAASPPPVYFSTSKHMCAARPGRDACIYDSGGPLVAANAYNWYTLVGVVEWGVQCAMVTNNLTPITQKPK